MTLLLLPNLAWAQFIAGPAARVIPNTQVQIRWRAPFVGTGRVDVFKDSAGSPDQLVTAAFSGSEGNDLEVDFSVGGLIAPDTTYYFKVTDSDPTGGRADLTNGPPLPSFFTGAQPPSADPVQPKLTAPDPYFWSVAVSGDLVVFGASSAAYLFVKPENGWATTSTPAAKLTATDGAGFSSVAIDGDTVVVGASSAPVAYVFVKPENGWVGNLSETAKLSASAPAFGSVASVAIDGDTVVVGAGQYGASFVFMKPAGGWTGNLNETAKLTAAGGPLFFAYSVAISGDTVVVGAYLDGADCGAGGVCEERGSAYVFVRPAGGWADTNTSAAKLTASNEQYRAWFGFSVAISGNTVVVGAPQKLSHGAAYVFVKPAAGWAGKLTESATVISSDVANVDFFLAFFGGSVAIGGDCVLIGANGNDGAKGSAYVFLKPAEGWAGNLNEAVKLTASDGETFDFFGSAVGISGDTLVVRADEWGDFQTSAYVLSKSTATDSRPPTISLTSPPDGEVYALNQMVNADYACQDEAGGSRLASCVGTVASGAAFDTATVGFKTFTVTAVDNAGNSASLSHTYAVIYNFSGFLPPINNRPVLNSMKAGAAAPVKFSLSGYQGLAIFETGYPKSEQIACDSTALVDGVDQTFVVGSSSLSYDAESDLYIYVWKTEKPWSGTCRQLVIKLNDGTVRRANFKFD